MKYKNLCSIFQDDDMILEPEQTMLEGSDEDPEQAGQIQIQPETYSAGLANEQK